MQAESFLKALRVLPIYHAQITGSLLLLLYAEWRHK
jgi:hypothetical protein